MQYVLLLLFSVLLASNANATITFVDNKWESTFDCAELNQMSGSTCDGWAWTTSEYLAGLDLTGGTNEWTNSSGNEWYYTGGLTLGTPDSVAIDAVLASAGSVGSLSSGQYAYSGGVFYVYSTVDPDTLDDNSVTCWIKRTSYVSGDYLTQVTSDANNTSGGGGRGFRFWLGDGSIINTLPVYQSFASKQPELWIRFYIRYEVGFTFAGDLTTDKFLYLYTGGTSQYLCWKDWTGDTLTCDAQGTPNPYQLITDTTGGYNSSIGGGTAYSDGLWHCIEIYLKMDTDTTDGAGRIWVDGILKAENTAMNWSGGNSSSYAGWDNFRFKTNSDSPHNGRTMYVDYDDMVLYNSTPPNTDAYGNAFIGLLSTGDTTPPTLDEINIQSSGNTTQFDFSENMAVGSDSYTNFDTLVLSGGSVTLSGCSITNDMVECNNSRTVAYGETFSSFAYTQPGDGLQDTASTPNDLATIASYAGAFSNNVSNPGDPTAYFNSGTTATLGSGTQVLFE